MECWISDDHGKETKLRKSVFEKVFSTIWLLSALTASAEQVSYDFTFEVATARYLGSDSNIEPFVATVGEVITGTLSYDTSSQGTTVGDTTRYPQTGLNAGLAIPQSNGVNWQSDSLSVRVIDRDMGRDVVIFEATSSDGATISLPGLAVDFLRLSLFYDTAAFGDITLQADYPMPVPIPGQELDIRAVDDNNSEFRVFGRLLSLDRVIPEPPQVCGQIALPSAPEFEDDQVYSCAGDFTSTGRFDADSQSDLQAYMMGGYGNVGDGVMKNLRVRFNPDPNTVIASPCSINFIGDRDVPVLVDNLTLLAGNTARVRPRSGDMTVSGNLTLVSRDELAILNSAGSVSVGELCLQGPIVRVKTAGRTTADLATLAATDGLAEPVNVDRTLEISNFALEDSVLRLKARMAEEGQ